MSLKQAFEEYASSLSAPDFTIGDLINAVRQDQSLNYQQREQVVQTINQSTGWRPVSTPLNSIMYGAFGAVIGNLIAKYFGMDIIGRTIATAAGFGVANMLLKQESPFKPMPGWYGIS